MNKQGFIDEKRVFQLAYGYLGLSFDSLDYLTPYEFNWLLEEKEAEQRDFYEMMANVVKVAMVSINRGKDIKLFNQDKHEEQQKMTKEDRDKELNELQSIFGKLE